MSKERADIPEQRQRRIVEIVRESGSVTVGRLEQEFGISPATARRDLGLLEELGQVKRTHGGAIMPRAVQNEDSFQQRLGEAVASKKRLARAAQESLGLDATIFVDSSTTAYYAAQRIFSGASRVTCLSNLVPAMELFSKVGASDASMIGLGGIFRPLTLSFVGPCTVRMVESYLADVSFFSVKGITADGQLTEPNPLEAEVKRAMIRQSEKPVLLVDGRKFRQRGASVISHVSEVGLVMTADALDSDIEMLMSHGVDVRSF